MAVARGLLADPAWTNKVARGQRDKIVECDYCNVCKNLDGTHKPVICALWPQGTLQAPAEGAAAPAWTDGDAGFSATVVAGGLELRWRKAPGAALYSLHRSAIDGAGKLVEMAKVTRWIDSTVLGGLRYEYELRALSADGQSLAEPARLVVEMPQPAYMRQAA